MPTDACATTPDGRVPWPRPPDQFLRNFSTAEFLRCTVAGGLAFGLDYSTLFLLVSIAHVHYLSAAAVGFVAGTIANYALNVRWVFDKRRVESVAREFQLFAAIMAIGLVINETFMWMLTGVLGAHYLFSKLAAASLVYCWSFSARKYVLF